MEIVTSIIQILIEFIKLFVLLGVPCHLVGDYVLQSDFIAKTKGENMYHLFVHSVLYCVPFGIVFVWASGLWLPVALVYLAITHFAIDILKTKNKITYLEDQAYHYVIIYTLVICFLSIKGEI